MVKKVVGLNPDPTVQKPENSHRQLSISNKCVS